MPEPQDIAALMTRAEAACRPCGPCDAGLPMGCNCDPEPRAVIAALLSEVERGRALRAAIEALAEEWRAEVTAPFGEAHMSFAFAAHMLERILAAHVPSPLPVGGAAGAGEGS